MKSLFSATDSSEHPAPQAVYNWKIYLLAISAAMGAALQGYDGAFIGGSLILPSFQQRFGLNETSSSELAANIVSTFQAGGFFGTIFAYLMTERFGRRVGLIACGLVFDVGAVLQIASHGSLPMLYVGRILTGFGVGAQSCITPMYIAEWSPPAIRGRLVSLFEIFLQLFTIIGFWVNYGVAINVSPKSDSQWQIPFGIQLLPGTLLAFMMLLQPESPRWLIAKGKTEMARQALARIRKLPADHEYVDYEVHSCEAQVAAEATSQDGNASFLGRLKEVFGKDNLRRVCLGIALMFIQNLTGVNALNYFSPTIFKSIGFTGTNVSLLATGIYGIVKGLSNGIFSLLFLDRVGRRPSLLIGAAGVMVAMYYLAAYSAISKSFVDPPPKDAGAYIAILMIYVFGVLYGFSWCGIPWVFTSEVFPNNIRSISFATTTLSQWLSQFMVVYSVPYMIRNITYGTFLLFGVSVTIGALVVYFFLPETKGLSMEEMDILFRQTGTASQMRKATERIIQDKKAENAALTLTAKDAEFGESSHIEIETA